VDTAMGIVGQKKTTGHCNTGDHSIGHSWTLDYIW
jgi:hypothetical protein